jgi:hypothetical protein
MAGSVRSYRCRYRTTLSIRRKRDEDLEAGRPVSPSGSLRNHRGLRANVYVAFARKNGATAHRVALPVPDSTGVT